MTPKFRRQIQFKGKEFGLNVNRFRGWRQTGARSLERNKNRLLIPICNQDDTVIDSRHFLAQFEATAKAGGVLSVCCLGKTIGTYCPHVNDLSVVGMPRLA
jgi:hypothetical protein